MRSNAGLLRGRTIDAVIVALLVVATLAWSLLAGKDLNFDQLHYHFYDAYSLLNDRLGKDFMPANGQSYLNPLAYVPFYWMVANDWPTMLIASTLAALHSLNIVFAYLIVRSVLPQAPHTIALLGAALALLSPTFLMISGTSFADPTTSALVLAAVYVLLRPADDRGSPAGLLVLAGLCVGAAGGLKLSNLVFGPAFAGLLIWLNPSLARSMRALVLFGLAAACGLAVTHGYWSWTLWQEFGTSAAPMLGILLGSPDMPAGAPLPQRFLPESLTEALSLPFRMAALRGWVYMESVAPDLRFAAAMTLLAAFVGIRLLRGRVASAPTPDDSGRRREALVIFFALVLALWIGTSANGRYGLMVSILCGPVVAVLLSECGRARAGIVVALSVLCVLQAFHLSHATLRWTDDQWGASWYETVIPERLKREPFLYISIGGNSHSYLAPYLAKGSAFTNPMGQTSFDFDTPGGDRLRALIDEYAGRVRVLAPANGLEDEGKFTHWLSWTRTSVARLGFEVDRNDCLMISSAGAWQAGDDVELPTAQLRNSVRTCALVPHEYEHAAERARMATITGKIAAWCPKFFLPSPGVVEGTPGGWYVLYASTDSRLNFRGSEVWLNQLRASSDVYLGTLKQWESSERPDCDAIPLKLRKKYTFK